MNERRRWRVTAAAILLVAGGTLIVWHGIDRTVIGAKQSAGLIEIVLGIWTIVCGGLTFLSGVEILRSKGRERPYGQLAGWAAVIYVLLSMVRG
jgi:drug/metabolite transporter (DMT)-like permease